MRVEYSFRQCTSIVASKGLTMAMAGRTNRPLLLVILHQTFVVLASLEHPPIYPPWPPYLSQPRLCLGSNFNCTGDCCCILPCTCDSPYPRATPLKRRLCPWPQKKLVIYTPPPLHHLDLRYPYSDPTYSSIGHCYNPHLWPH